MKKADIYPFGFLLLILLNKILGLTQSHSIQSFCLLLVLILFIIGIIIYKPEEYENPTKATVFSFLCSTSFVLGVIAIFSKIYNYSNLASFYFEIPNLILFSFLVFLLIRIQKDDIDKMAGFVKSLLVRSSILLVLFLIVVALPYNVINLYLNKDFPILYQRGLTEKYRDLAISSAASGDYDMGLTYADKTMAAQRKGWPGDTPYFAYYAYRDVYMGIMNDRYTKGEYDSALSYANLAERCAKIYNGDSSDAVANIKTIQGGIYSVFRQYKQSNALLLEAIAIYRSNDNKEMVFSTMDYMARTLRSRLDLVGANKIFKEIIYELDDSLAKLNESPKSAVSIEEINTYKASTEASIGLDYSLLEEYDSADIYFSRSLETKKFAQSADYPVALSEYAYHLLRKGEYQHAKSSMEEALRIWPKEKAKTGNEYLFAALGLNSINIAMAKYDEAEHGCHNVLDLLDNKHQNRKKNIEVLIQLATVKYYQAYYDTAKLLLQECGAGTNPKSIQYAGILVLLSSIDADLALYPDALSQAKEARQLATDEDGSHMTKFLRNEAYMDYLTGDIKQSKKLYLQCLGLDLSDTGPNRLDLGATYNGLGLIKTSEKKYKEADAYFDSVISIYGRLIGKGHPDYATVLYNKANMKLEKGDLTESESLFNESLETMTKVLGDKHDKVADDLVGLGEVKLRQRNITDALKYFVRANDIYRLRFKEDHKKVILSSHYIEQCKKKI